MGRIVPEQRWGLGRVPGIRFKGGWGPSERPEGGYEVIQVGIAGAEGDRGRGTRGGLRGCGAASLEACAATSEHSITSIPGHRGRDPRIRAPVRPQDQRLLEAVAGEQRGLRARRRRGHRGGAHLLGDSSRAPPKDREIEAAKAKARSAARYAA